MNKPRRIFVIGVAFATVLLVAALMGYRSGPRRELENFKAKLRAKGEKLSYSELAGVRPVRATNSLAVLTNAVNQLNNARYYPANFDFRKLVGPGLAQPAWKAAMPPWSSQGRRPGWEELIAQNEEMRPVLEDLRGALKDPDPDAGPPSGVLGSRRSNFVAVRTAAQWLASLAICEVHQGHLEEALENIEALSGVALMNRTEYTLVAQMIRVAVTSLGVSVTWEALQAPGWTEPQLARLQKTWEQVDLLEALETGFVGERAQAEELWSQMRGSKARKLMPLLVGQAGSNLSPRDRAEDLFGKYVVIPVYKLTSIDSDELFYLKEIQDGLDTVRALKAGTRWPDAKQSSDQGIARLSQMGKRWSLSYLLSSIALPNYSRAANTAARNETERRMALVAVALERSKLRNGKYPADLGSLAPEFLASVPLDPMSGRGFGYQLKTDGTFVLYSVGEDGVDNGGDPNPASTNRPSIWDGHDALWPAAR